MSDTNASSTKFTFSTVVDWWINANEKMFPLESNVFHIFGRADDPRARVVEDDPGVLLPPLHLMDVGGDLVLGVHLLVHGDELVGDGLLDPVYVSA